MAIIMAKRRMCRELFEGEKDGTAQATKVAGLLSEGDG